MGSVYSPPCVYRFEVPRMVIVSIPKNSPRPPRACAVMIEEIEKFFKFQGINNLSDFLGEHQEVSDFIYEKIRELF